MPFLDREEGRTGALATTFKAKQTTVMLIVAIAGVALYLYCGMKNGKKPRADDLLTFAMWCSAIVAGCHMLLGSTERTRTKSHPPLRRVMLWGVNAARLAGRSE